MTRRQQYDIAIRITKEYIWDLPEPECTWPKRQFDQKRFAIWSANELLKRLSKPSKKDVWDLIEEVVYEMDYYSVENDLYSFMFSVAHDTVLDIYDRILAAI